MYCATPPPIVADLRRPDMPRPVGGAGLPSPAAAACSACSSVLPAYEQALIGSTGAVSRRLGDLALVAAGLPADERRPPSPPSEETLGVLHLIAPPARLRPVLDHIQNLAGAA